MTLSLMLLAGVLVTAGLVALVAAFKPAAPRLGPALEWIGAEPAGPRTVDVGRVDRPSERLGAWLYRVTPIPLTIRQRAALRLRGKSIAEFYADKFVMALVCALLPGFAAYTIGSLSRHVSAFPGVVVVAGAVAGFFLPDLLLLRGSRQTHGGAVESLLVFIDLVTLERLANASATQALRNAAEVSEAPLFLQIRTALDRAQLEQRPPYAELRRVADQLSLPQLADLADVMQLDESGAALADTLRARVRELRDAHLTSEQLRASAAAEGMTIYMTLPALIFGVIVMTAALLRIVFS